MRVQWLHPLSISLWRFSDLIIVGEVGAKTILRPYLLNVFYFNEISLFFVAAGLG